MLVGYLIEPHLVKTLEAAASDLHRGTDKERDLGHVLWLLVEELKALPLTEEDLLCSTLVTYPLGG